VHLARRALVAGPALLLAISYSPFVPVDAAPTDEHPQSTSNSILLSDDSDHPGAGVTSVEHVTVVRPGAAAGSSTGGRAGGTGGSESGRRGGDERGQRPARPAAPARPQRCTTSTHHWILQWAMDGLAQMHGKRGAYHAPVRSMVAGHRYYRECRFLDDGSVDRDAFVYSPAPPGPAPDPIAAAPAATPAPVAPQIDIMTIVRQVYAEVPLALPVPHTSPPVDADQLVGFPMWMWVDDGVWHTFDAHASVAGVTVTVVAQPKALRWDLGDGTVMSCAGPGTPWVDGGGDDQRSDCSHIYQYVSAHEPDGRYHASVTVTWSVTWSASTGEAGGLPDASRSAGFDLNVVERQAVITYGGG
jgi:hypothetical protein